jgi:hypothetical protein
MAVPNKTFRRSASGSTYRAALADSCQKVHPVAGFPLYDGFNSLAIRAENSRYDLASRERLIVSFAGISSDQSRSQGRAFGARGDHAAGPLRSKSCFSGFEVSRA